MNEREQIVDKNIPWEIIIKKFKDDIPTDEEKMLNEWLTFENHQSIYIELEALWYSIINEGVEYKSSADALWSQMEARMKKMQPKEVRFPLHKFKWVSAVASVLLFILLSFTGYVTKQWYNSNTIVQTYSSFNGKSKVILPDGTEVWLNSQSKIEYATSFWGRQRNINLNGEALFNVSKDPDRPFIVKSHGMQVKVYGTTFNVEAKSNSKNMIVSLLSGSVSVTSGNETKWIEPGEVAICTKNTGQISVDKSDVSFATMWANDHLRIEQKSIKELTKYLAKWYGIRFVFDPTIPEDQAYTFTIKDEPLEEVLRLMARTNPIRYSFDENNVIKITKK